MSEKDIWELLSYFKYDHLPEMQAAVSKPFCDLARGMAEVVPDCLDKVEMLRKLLEAKDCAVRASLKEV